MTFAPPIYLLPLLLGYLLFVGISGRFDPLSRPGRLAERPWWLLGLWTGLTTALVLIGVMKALGERPPEQTFTLLASSGWAVAGLMLPGLLLWQLYRDVVDRQADERASAARSDALSPNRHPPTTRSPEPSTAVARKPARSPGERRHGDTGLGEPLGLDRTGAPPVAAFLSHIAPGPVDVPNIPVAPSESRAAGETGSGETRLGTGGGASISFARRENPFEPAFREERRLRTETEKHLRITRRALGVLAKESGERERVDALTSLEGELESRLRKSAATEEALDRQTARCNALERELARVKRDTASARHAVRRGAAARERALGTATRSLQLARRALQVRADVEERLRESEERLAARQATIGSLVSALEQARNRSRRTGPGAPDAQSAEAPRKPSNVETLVPTADNRLGARLARKAARVRPLTTRG